MTLGNTTVRTEMASFLVVLDNYTLLTDGSYAPVILRLAWHSAGTFDKETGTGGR
jgi:catalase (peroxidase I)